MALSEAAKEARREYRRQWAKNNPDKVKAQAARYWERRAARLADRERDLHNMQTPEGANKEEKDAQGSQRE